MTTGRTVALVLALWSSACQRAPDMADPAVVERGSLVVFVDVSGTLRAVDSDRVGPPGISGVWNYKIAMLAPEGEVAQKGQPVLVLDTSEQQRQLEAKVAERDSAATSLELKRASARVARQDERLAIAEAEAEVRKAEIKAASGAGFDARIDVEKARLDLALARDKVDYLERKSKSAADRDEAEIAAWRSKRDRAEERVTEMQAAIEQMTVLSPRTGTVIYQVNWQGEKKKVGDSAWRAETVLSIVSLGEMQADGEIDEVDINRVAVDQEVSLRLDAQADLEVRGHVKRISHTVQRASPENPLKVARLDIALAASDDTRLRPGMRFRGRIETERHDDVLLVPLDTVISTPQGPVVHRGNDSGVEAVVVELGPRNGDSVIVTSGLQEGDTVLRAQEITP